MLKLKVPDMSCGHCASTIEKAIKSIDPTAKVKIDFASTTVAVETQASEKTISDAISAAGYNNTKVAA